MNINQAIINFLELTNDARSENTARTYGNGLRMFAAFTPDGGNSPVSELTIDPVKWFIKSLKNKAAKTEQVYLVAVTLFYTYLVAEELAEINMEKLKMIVQTRSRRPGERLPKFPKKAIGLVIKYACGQMRETGSNGNSKALLRQLRDAAIILTLADTGLRIHELCGLKYGDVDFVNHKAVIVGKGDTEAVIRFSPRAINAIVKYTDTRHKCLNIDPPHDQLPLFAQHYRGKYDELTPISTDTGRNIILKRGREALKGTGIDAGNIKLTPHSFRHYFVTIVLKKSGGNLKLAQELARHKNIQVTQRYAHLSDDDLDRGHADIFNT